MIPEQITQVEGLDIHLLTLSRLDDRPETLTLPSSQFIMLFLADSREVTGSQIMEFMKWCLKQGLVYLCTWGPDCERVHDIADEVIVDAEIAAGHELPTIITTWHEKDQLKDVLWYALHTASPDEAFGQSCTSLLIVTLNNQKWESQVRELLKQPAYFPS